MEAKRLATLMSLFDGAIDVPGHQRAAFVDEVCGNDRALADELLSLLASHDGADDWFARLATDAVSPAAAALLHQELPADTTLQSRLQVALGERYRILRKIGSGRSRVFLAEEVALSRQVVIKVLPPDVAAPGPAPRFRREIQLAAQLQHAHIVPVLASDSADGFLYYTMPFVAGETLRERLAREGALTVDDARRLWQDILEALAHAHARGVVHRDIKPANILVDGRSALVTDFGIARAIEVAGAESPDVPSGFVIGTPAYMAPEQLVGAATAAPPADLYAAALVMYEMLTGRLPFSGESPRDVVLGRLTKDAASLHVPGAPPELTNLVMRCLSREPERRPASVDAVLAALDAGRNTGAPGGTTYAPPQPPHRLRSLFVGLSTALALALALAFGLWRPGPGGSDRVTAQGARSDRPTSRSVEAQEWYQRGMDAKLARSPAGREQAMSYLDRAIASDSNYAAAWAGRVNLMLLVSSDLPRYDELALDRAEAVARRAITLDDSLGAAHAALGWVQSVRWQWAASESSFTRAIALDRRTPQAYEGLARTYLWTGPVSAQLDAARQAAEVDPFSYSAVREYALARAMNNQCDEAVARLRPFKSITPPAYVAGLIIGQCHAAEGRWSEAVAEFQWAMDSGVSRAALGFLTMALFRTGQHTRARAYLADMIAGRLYSDGAFGIALAYLGQRDSDSTFVWLERSVEEHSMRAYVMGPLFTELRRNPRFEGIRHRMALPGPPSSR